MAKTRTKKRSRMRGPSTQVFRPFKEEPLVRDLPGRPPEFRMPIGTAYTFEEGLEEVNKEGSFIANNWQVTDPMRCFSIVRRISYRENCMMKLNAPVWCGTLVAYIEPGKKLKKVIEYTEVRPDGSQITWVFPVPQKYRGMEDVALCIEHPEFKITKRGSKRFVGFEERDLRIVRDFPSENGQYFPGSCNIPWGEKVGRRKRGIPMTTLELIRIGIRVGPVAAAPNQVRLDIPPSTPRPIAVESRYSLWTANELVIMVFGDVISFREKNDFDSIPLIRDGEPEYVEEAMRLYRVLKTLEDKPHLMMESEEFCKAMEDKEKREVR